MALEQQYNQEVMQVQQQSAQQKSALEQQAMQLTMEYQQKKSQEEMMAKQQQLQREHIDAQMKFAQEMQKLQNPIDVSFSACHAAKNIDNTTFSEILIENLATTGRSLESLVEDVSTEKIEL